MTPTDISRFPFGQPLRPVVQTDRRPKQVFVLGVYASAVHARWIGADGKDVVKALAVASEPRIFWRGEDAGAIISQIAIPPAVGRLVPADPQFNGPSGIALDELFLGPLGLRREDAWLCDLVPHSCVSGSQQAAIARAYAPLVEEHGLPTACIPPVPGRLADQARREAILAEIRESKAQTLVLLGDQPIRWFLRHFDDRWGKLADFPAYGEKHPVKLDGLALEVLPLAHPRQVAQLGKSSQRWFEQHRAWVQSICPMSPRP